MEKNKQYLVGGAIAIIVLFLLNSPVVKTQSVSWQSTGDSLLNTLNQLFGAIVNNPTALIILIIIVGGTIIFWKK